MTMRHVFAPLHVKSQFFLRLSALFIPSALLILVVSFFIYRSEVERDLNRSKIRETLGVAAGAETIRHKLNIVAVNLKYLADHDALNQVIERPDIPGMSHLEQDFSHFIHSVRMYDKVRWIEAGKERFRVEFRGGKAVVVPPALLQNTLNRYYVAAVRGLKPGDIYVSPFDLNIENDKIEVPYKPVIRLATPLSDRSGKGRGFIVLSYLGKDLLDDFVKAASRFTGNMMLLNRDGYWLRSPVSEDEWGFMFGREENFATRYPSVWRRMVDMERGQFQTGEGLWTVDTIRPSAVVSDSPDGFSPHPGREGQEPDRWKIVSHLPASAIEGAGSEHVAAIIWFSLPLLLIAFLGSWRLAWTWIGRMEAQAETKQIAARMSMLLENLGEGVFGLDADGLCIFINPAALAMVGYAHDEVIGRSAHHLFQDTGVLDFSARDRSRTPAADKRRSGEDWFVKKDGTRFPVQLFDTPIVQSNAVVGAVVAFQDISERRWAEDAIRKQIEFTELLISNASAAIFVLAEGHKVLYWNKACEKLTGVPAADVIGTGDHWKPFYAYERPCLADLVLEGRTGDNSLYAIITPSPLLQGGLHSEGWFRNLGGSDRYLTIESAPIRNAEGKAFAAIESIQDITEHKRTEEAQRESESRYRMLIENSPDTVFLQSEGYFIYLNSAGVKLFGASCPEDLLGTRVIDRVHPDTRPLVRERMRMLMEERRPVGVAQETYLRLDGTPVSVEVLATPFSYYERPAAQVIVRDVTERKQMVSELQSVKQRLELAIDSGQLGIWDWDIEKDEMVWNDRMLELYGLTRGQLTGTGRDWRQNIHTDDVQRAVAAIESAISDGLDYEVEFRTLHLGGGSREIKLDGIVVRSAEGKAMRMIGMSRDVTERKHLEAQLRQAQKMEAIGTLAGGIAHDFNNILTAIVGYAHLMHIRMHVDDPLLDDVREILRSADHAAQLTKSLLAFSRKQSMKVELVELGELVRSFEQFLTRMIGEDVDLRIEADGDLGVIADRSQLEQVLMNLATNARDAMPHGGMLSIQASREEIREGFVRTRGFGKEGIYARLSVRDSGTGMDEEVCRRVFEPFFTTKEMGKGTGLGLAIAYGIVKQHQGYIDVSSTLGKGTSFHIYLPLAAGERDRAQNLLEVRGKLPEGSETILVVEDNEDVQRIIRRMLERAGYSVITANNGDEAIPVFHAHGSKIELVITDVIMPKKNGLQLYEELRRRNPAIKILFMSGYTADVVTLKELTSAGLPFLAKPVDPKALLMQVREILAKR